MLVEPSLFLNFASFFHQIKRANSVLSSSVWEMNLLLIVALAFSVASVSGIAIRNGDDAKSDANTIRPEEVEKLRKSLMYPYEDKDYLEDIKHNTPRTRRVFEFEIPFYGFYYNYTLISLNGHIYFGSSYFKGLPIKYPQSFPENRWPDVDDPAFIAPFLMKSTIGQTVPGQLRGGVYMRILSFNEETNASREDKELKQAVKLDIREGIIGALEFDPTHILIFTWRNITFADGINKKVTNTYQLLVATDEVRTYAIFNYDRLQWTSSAESGGDVTTGLGGISAFVGFNGGNRTSTFEYKPFSQTSKILQLLTEGRSNSKNGRHIFRIDEEIVAGSCNSGAGHSGKLFLSPESGSVLGGTVVNITGPCFTPKTNYTVVFHDQETICTAINYNVARCVTPAIYTSGYVDVAVSLEIGQPLYKTKFYIENPLLPRDEVSVEGPKTEVLLLKWNHSSLIANRREKVNINLFGYTENENKVKLELLGRLAVVFNSGVHEFKSSLFKNMTEKMNPGYTMGLLQVNVSQPFGFSGVPVLWSRPLALDFLFKDRWEEMLGKDWAAVFCNNWVESEKRLDNFVPMLPKCPCTLSKAEADRGFFVPDFECDKRGNIDCSGSKKALHCVRLGQPTVNGTDQRCCYFGDGILVTNDIQASTALRVHPFGFYPYNQARKVPGLSYWYHERMPYLFCCRWQSKNSDSCQVHEMKRPSQDCSGHLPSNAAIVFGDPHVITFDDFEYSFNANGEYTLLKAKKGDVSLNIQGRFERVLKTNYGKIVKLNATQLTAVAMAEGKSSVVEIRRRQPGSDKRYKLTVLVDNRTIYFDQTYKKMQSYKGVTVYVQGNVFNQSQVVVVFQSGAAVEVKEVRGQIAAIAYLPTAFKFRTLGLFGNYSGNPLDDLTLPLPLAPLPLNSSVQEIYEQFKNHWVVGVSNSAEKSLFYQEFNRNSSLYYNNNFKTIFEIPPREDLDFWLDRFCGPNTPYNRACRFDYAVTDDKNFAVSTKYIRDSFENLKLDQLRP